MKFNCQVCRCEYDTIEFENLIYGLRGNEDRCEQCDVKLQIPEVPANSGEDQ